MAEAFIGEFRMFAGNYAPVHWSFCDGQIISVNANPALYSLLGTAYGGDGVSSFGLPDLRGRIPVGEGTGVGLTPRLMGQKQGSETVFLGVQHLPPHTHASLPGLDAATSTEPDGCVTGNVAPYEMYETFNTAADIVQLNENCIHSSGGDQAHDNVMPFMCISFIISMKGTYPSRS